MYLPLKNNELSSKIIGIMINNYYKSYMSF